MKFTDMYKQMIKIQGNELHKPRGCWRNMFQKVDASNRLITRSNWRSLKNKPVALAQESNVIKQWPRAWRRKDGIEKCVESTVFGDSLGCWEDG